MTRQRSPWVPKSHGVIMLIKLWTAGLIVLMLMGVRPYGGPVFSVISSASITFVVTHC